MRRLGGWPLLMGLGWDLGVGVVIHGVALLTLWRWRGSEPALADSDDA